MNSIGVLILTGLADGDKHGYALTKDVDAFAEVKLAPGTLYEALQPLGRQALIEPLEPVERRLAYRLTAAGASALQDQLDGQRRVTETGLRRLAAFPAAAANAGALAATATARVA
jgi:DNA-binding PadR family transcriptional regulator